MSVFRQGWGAVSEAGGSPVALAPFNASEPARARAWLWPALRVLLIAAAACGAWYIAENWNRWAGEGRTQTTDDAFLAGDLTPLSAKVSGYITGIPVADFATVRQGDIVAQIEPSDYLARLAQANANRAAAAALLANIANQKAIQRASIRQALANIDATAADVTRSHLEAERQRSLLHSNLAGTLQAVERADADAKRFAAQLRLNLAVLDQQKGLLDSLDVQERQLAAQRDAADAQLRLAQNDLDYTRIRSPVDGMMGLRQVRTGQFVNVGTQIAVVMPLPRIWVIANYKETQMTHIRAGQIARVTVDAFPDIVLTGRVDSWSPATGSVFALLAPDNATGNFTKVVQRMPVKIVLDANPALGPLVRPGMSVEATIDTASAPDNSGPEPRRP